MKVTDLDFSFPDDLIATEPVRPTRVMWVQDEIPHEITVQDLLQKIPAGDVLVINTTQVLKRRIFALDPQKPQHEVEVLFLSSQDQITWDVLFPSKGFSVGEELLLPGDIKMTLVEKGRPQRVRTSAPLEEVYFERVAEMPLPPYIQKMRLQRHSQQADEGWYQTAWAQNPGSLAAPTASLHFTKEDLNTLRDRGVYVVSIILHVGLGTFLPVTTENLEDHKMHEEFMHISDFSWQIIQAAHENGHKVWALGTTVARALESRALQKGTLFKTTTDLMIRPGHRWRIVDRLLTNFHQPQSTLLALVCAFAGFDNVMRCYRWAIDRKMRLFSYGDLSVWVDDP